MSRVGGKPRKQEALMSRIAWIIVSIATALTASVARGEELTVMSGAAVEPGLKAAVAAFEEETGHQVTITFNTTPQMRERVAAGDTFDVVIASQGAIQDFIEAGKAEAGGAGLGRVGSGVAVRTGTPVPAIATADDIQKAVLEADSVVFNRASTGLYIENLLKKMGVYEQIEAKTVRYTTGAEVMQHVLKGAGNEIGFGPITEILPEREHGLVYVGPLPPDIQNYTAYVAAPMTAGTQRELARQLVAYLGGPIGKPLFVANGIE
jgi:molybdate transport system substrate-binding protein